ncbi:tetratricopeptide repeat protein [Paludibacterium paludis]|uniref:Tetratricopeptide repeat protein n=1 Tax=Paludibacterium paludis TaxID=1225769 RepID=A0A918P712_9NEIS|nr:tetratricopeptide repeat protein [Paludibacterium paludis]GGY28936.1 hypothetical protein GCM10011289_35140 [Paludibacterium paludis]
MTNDTSRRLDQWLAYLKADPDNPSLLLAVADAAYQEREFALAHGTASRLLEREPGHLEATSLLGLCELSLGHAGAAADHFARLVSDGHRAAPLLYNLAYALMLDGRDGEAEPWAREATDCEEIREMAAPLYATLLHRQGRVPEAIAFAEETLRQHPALAERFGQLATLYLDDSRWDDAERQARSVLGMAPRDPDANTVMGMIALSRQDTETAHRYFGVAMDNKPGSGRAAIGQGLGRMLDGDLHGAEERLAFAAQRLPGHIGTWHALAWCQFLDNRIADAKATFAHALELDRNFADSHGALAVIAIAEGRMEEARQACRRALGLDSGSFSGVFAQSLLLQAAGKEQEAAGLIARLSGTAILPDGSTLQQAVARALIARQS